MAAGQQSAADRMREAARRRAEEESHGSGGGTKFKLPDGMEFFNVSESVDKHNIVNFDVIPYTITDPLHPDVRAGRLQVGDFVEGRTIWVHRNMGVEEKGYICLKTWGKKCPCQHMYEDTVKKYGAKSEEAKAIKAKERRLFNVIDLGKPKQPVEFWDYSYHLFAKLLEQEQGIRPEYYGFALLDGGYTLEVRFSEESMGSGRKGDSFLDASRIDFRARKPYSEDILKEVAPIDDCLVQLPYDQLEKIFMGIDDDDVEGSAGKQAPAGQRETRGGRGGEDARREPARAEQKQPQEERTAAPTGRAERSTRDTAPVGRGTGRQTADTIHDKQPDAQGERGRHEAEAGRHAVDPGQDCPANGKFGEDCGKYDECDGAAGKPACVNWEGCRDAQDEHKRKARQASAPAAPPSRQAPAAGGGTRGTGRAGR